MNNSDYWKNRFGILEEMKNQNAGIVNAEIEIQFKKAQQTLDDQINAWYGRFAKNNQITLAEAKTWLSGKDLDEFKWSVDDFIKYGKEAAVDPALIKQLENASARFHVSKLEALKLQTQTTIEKLYGNTQGATSSLFGQIYKDGYYHTAFELQQGFGVGWDFAALNESQIESVLSKPWTLDKQTFSDRLWTQKQSLLNEVHTQLTQNMILGKAPDDAIKAISTKFNTSKQNAGRLVMTESAYFANVAQRNAFLALDVEQYEVVETLDGETCPICGALDGKVFKMSEYEAGTTAPPFHPWCRGCTAPYFADDDGERAARDEDGKTYYVPQDMTYPDWKETFVDGTKPKTGFTEITKNGVVHFTPDVPLPPEPVKKEYLTKNKLQENITDIDSKVKDLEDKYGGDVFGNGTVGDMQSYVDLNKQKTEFQELLDKKLLTEQKKSLTKQQTVLQAEFDTLQEEVKSYSGIWKDDVSTVDWKSKSASIQSKKDYFQQQLDAASFPADEDKWKQLINDLDEFDTTGQHYYQVQTELNKVQTSLTSLKKNAIIKGDIDDAFTQARKDAALWAKTPQEADDALRDVCGDVWQNATKTERKAIYDYTSGSGGFNRPLRGYQGSWGSNKGIGNVDLDYEGKADAIKKMTALIDKSTYDIDVWLQRGVESATGASGFLGISESELKNLSESELVQKLLNKEVIDEAFLSCGSAKGKGFSGYIFNIYCPKGTKMMYSEPFSHYSGASVKLNWDGKSTQSYFGYEDETIIQRGTKFRITKVEKHYDKYYFDVEVIGQP